MKLLFVVQHLGPEGGMERFLDIVLPAIAARGIDVHVLARTIDAVPSGCSAQHIAWADEHDEPDAAAAADVLRCWARIAPDCVVAQNVMDAGVVEALRAAPRLVYQVCDHRPFCPNGDRLFPRTGDICTARIGAACVVHAATDGCAYGPRLRTLSLINRRRRLRDAVAAADSVLVDSCYMFDEAVRNGIAPARVIQIAQPLADDDYAEYSRLETPHSKRVAFLGRFVPQKGLVSLVRALGRIDAARRPQLVALGDGPERGIAEQEARRLGVVLDARGNAGVNGVHAAIDACSAVVVPSLWAEPFGRVGIEAFARGRTVIAYDVGGISAWLDHERNGIAVARGDEAGLAAAIVRVCDDDALRGRLAAAGREDAETHRIGAALDRLLAIMDAGARQPAVAG
jgi:glycosyltransferase involved in cell wall biosynthesis